MKFTFVAIGPEKSMIVRCMIGNRKTETYM